ASAPKDHGTAATPARAWSSALATCNCSMAPAGWNTVCSAVSCRDARREAPCTMTPSAAPFQEAHLSATPIRALNLRIEGTPLEAVLAEFVEELHGAGIRLRPRFYLSTEWGVPFGSIAIAIPFYLARSELTRLHAERVGHLEGVGRADL